MEGMYMSVEVISIILAAAGILITLGGGFLAGLAWVLRRMDEQFDKVDKRFDRIDQRFDRVDQRFEEVDRRFEKVDERFDRMDERIRQVQSELNEVKVAVARLEGPQPRLILPR
jgi:septal ring factor EnvC (AmiA/AmiB activator)